MTCNFVTVSNCSENIALISVFQFYFWILKTGSQVKGRMTKNGSILFFVDDIALATGKGAVFILHIYIRRYKQTFLSYLFSKNVFETHWHTLTLKARLNIQVQHTISALHFWRAYLDLNQGNLFISCNPMQKTHVETECGNSALTMSTTVGNF